MTDDTGAGNGGYDDRTIGRRLRRIRQSRKLSLAVVAGLAGISTGHLSRIERGERALDRRSVTVALADALKVSPSEITSLPIPAPADGDSDSAISAVRVALMAVGTGQPDGQVQSVAELRHRLREIDDVDYRVRGALYPALIADLHETLNQGHLSTTDHAALLRMAVMMHARHLSSYLTNIGAPLDLRWQLRLLARESAGELNDPLFSGVVSWTTTLLIMNSGAFHLALRELDTTTVPTTTHEGRQLDGMLALSRSLIAASTNQPAEVTASLDHAADMAKRTGQGDAFKMGFGPVNVGLWRMASALESDDPDGAIRVAQGLQPTEHPSRERRATYWTDYGRALARVRRRDDAVRALRRGEALFPLRVQRNPFARDTLAELRPHSKNDAIGRELRGMCYRAGLPG